MEITSQLASLEDEVKLLKGEIKSVLKEIRAAVLNQDNPFGSNNITLGGAAAPAPAAAPVASEPQPQPAPAPIPFPFPEPARATANPLDARPDPQQLFSAEPTPPSYRAPEPAQLSTERMDVDRGPDPSDPRPSLLTIASLLAWVEDTVASLGPRRFRLTLELAYFAELLSPEVRDVLRDLPQLWPEAEEPERPVGVNECLLVLRQLEAILQGEQITRLPRRRKRRNARSFAHPSREVLP